MKSSIHLIPLISILISTNCQNIDKNQSGSEEYIPGDYQSGDYQSGSGDYQSGDYYYYSDSNQILEFANFTKCCPEDQVYDLQYKKCKEISSDFSNIPISPNEKDQCFGTTVNIVNTIVNIPTCPENYVLIRLLNQGDVDICETYEFLTYFNREDKWVVVDSRGRRDSRKAHYGDFCIDRYYFGNRYMGNIALVCELPEEIYCKENNCLQHCCEHDHYWDETTGDCVRIDFNLEEVKWLNFDKSKQIDNLNFTELTNIYGHGYVELTCDEGDAPLEVNLEEFDVKYLPYGEIDIEGARFPFGKHCYVRQGYQDGNATAFSQKVYGCSNYFSNSDYSKWEQEVHLKVIPALFFISILFLGLLMVHIWRTQRSKLFGWLLLSAVTMLFVFYVFNSAIKLIVDPDIKSICEISGLIIQFSYMSSVLWLSCMSFLMWKTFRTMTPANLAGQKYTWGCQHPSFKWYAIFSWGLPLIMTIVTLILEHSKLGESYVAPNIGVDHCFLGSGLPTLLYFHVINAPALVINMVFFILFLWNMLCGVWANQAGDPVVAQQNRQKMHVVIKMFFVMGVSWIAEIILFFVNWLVGVQKIYKGIFLFQLINSLQGFIMFCVIYFDTARVKKIMGYVQSKTGTTNDDGTNGKMNRKSSDMSLSTLSTIGTGYTSFKRRFSSASQTTTNTELPHIAE